MQWTNTPSLKQVLDSIDGKYSVLMSFDSQGIHTFDPGLDGMEVNDLYYLAPGYGYWIKMTEPAELHY